jgi:serine/threonine protein kinase
MVVGAGDKPANGSRPSALRAMSTGGLIIPTGAASGIATGDNEFDEVEVPSPILSTPHQGLDQLSESLAQLINQRRYSHEPSLDDGKGVLSNGTTIRSSQLGIESSSLLAPPLSDDHRADRRISTGSSSSNRSTPPGSGHVFPSTGNPYKAETHPKSPTNPSSSTTTAAGKNTSTVVGNSAINMLRRASADRSAAGPSSSTATSPPESGSSTPRHFAKAKPQVTETTHLQLQTHAPSGRRMINQYIIETELGRGVHGKVRLARDTETGEKVAVKIVEREGKKRLGMGNGPMSRAGKEDAASIKGKAADRRNGSADSSNVRTHFADPSMMPLSKEDKPINSLVAKYGRKKSGLNDDGSKEHAKEREIEKAAARKRQLWTTDKKVKREIALLKKCAHENVVQLKEVIDDPSSKKIFMVLEFMEGGEVQWKDDRGFPTLTVDEARRTLRDVVLGLEYLHYQGIIHRDIKPANLLWDANRKVKISDFGVSHFSYALLVASGGLPSLDSDEERMKDPSLVDDHELAKTAGSPAFFAPELCLSGDSLNTAASQVMTPDRSVGWEDRGAEFPWIHPRQDLTEATSNTLVTPGRKNRPPITKAIDVWALGVTLYCLLFGHVPFMADSEFALFAAIPREDYEIPTYMGADRVRVGLRKKRWTYTPQWKDEESDVDSEHDEETEAEVDASTLGEEARLVRDLLDRLLEKDPMKRIKLDEVKKHPWLVRDLENPPQWLSETDPTQLPFVEVSNEEVDGALTGFSRLKQTFKKFFAGLGVQSHHHGSERDNHRLQGLGGPVQRQRSKSASHANPLFVLSPLTKQAPKTGTSTPSTLPKPAPSLRPNLFSRRQSTTAPGTPPETTLKEDKSRSQPNSRPESPAILDQSHDGQPASEPAQDKRDHLEVGRNPQPSRRPSSFFKRAVSGRETPLNLRKKTSTDAALSSAQSSRPSSNAGTLRTDANASKSDYGSHDIRTSLESDPSHGSIVSGSQVGHLVSQDSISSNRTRNRSKLGEVLRNVLGHHDRGSNQKPRSRPGTAPNNTAPSSVRGSHRSLRPVLSAYSVTPISTDLEQPPKTQVTEENSAFLSLPVDHIESQGGLRAHSIEVDDYDVDLDLSDDDLDDEKGHEERRAHMIMRNSGQGWVMERNSSSTSRHSNNDRTPSVEGGYNLFKPAYTGHVSDDDDEAVEDEDMETYAMAQVHSDEAEALRRASAKEMEKGRSQGLMQQHQQAAMMQHHHQELDLNDLSNMTDDRFADADEEDSTAIYDEDHDTEDDGDEDDGVSFQARARTQS